MVNKNKPAKMRTLQTVGPLSPCKSMKNVVQPY